MNCVVVLGFFTGNKKDRFGGSFGTYAGPFQSEEEARQWLLQNGFVFFHPDTMRASREVKEKLKFHYREGKRRRQVTLNPSKTTMPNSITGSILVLIPATQVKLEA